MGDHVTVIDVHIPEDAVTHVDVIRPNVPPSAYVSLAVSMRRLQHHVETIRQPRITATERPDL